MISCQRQNSHRHFGAQNFLCTPYPYSIFFSWKQKMGNDIANICRKCTKESRLNNMKSFILRYCVFVIMLLLFGMKLCIIPSSLSVPTEDGSTYVSSSPNSLRPISYFVSIWELYVLDLKTKVFCRKQNQLHFPMNKGLTVPK